MAFSVHYEPKDTSLGDAVKSAFVEFNRRKSEDELRRQQQAQFDTSLAEQKRLNDAAILAHKSAAGSNDASTARTQYQTLDDRAKAFAEGVIQKADATAASGDHAAAAQYTVKALEQLDSILEKSKGTPLEADTQRFRQLVGERLLSRFVDTPDTKADEMKRNTFSTMSDVTGRAAAAHGVVAPGSGANASDMAITTRLGTGADMPNYVFGDVQQQGEGPKAYERYAAIAGGRAPSAADTLTAETSRRNQESSNATQIKVAGINADARETAALAKTTAANSGASSPEAVKFKNEAIRLAKELLNDPGLSSAVGTTFNPSHGFGYKDSDKPISGTAAADFAVRAKRLAGLLSVESLKSKFLPGQMSDSDREMIISLSSTLGNLGQKEDSYRNELSRIITQNDPDASGGYMGSGANLLTDPNEVLNLFQTRR